LSIAYARNYGEQNYVLTNWVVGSMEVWMLCLALAYQKEFRGNGIVIIDIMRGN